MAIVTLTIDGEQLSAKDDESLLQVARQHKIDIPTLCHLDGISDVGACRLCLVEVEGWTKLAPACTTRPLEGMVVHTSTDRLKKYRRMIVGLLASEGNHQCAVCTVNNHCELQNLAYDVGLLYVRVPYLYPDKHIDASHESFILDHNRCVLCTRCVRVCHEVEGAHVWDVASRGVNSRIVCELNLPWGESKSCTNCGKCVQVCPTGALAEKGRAVEEMVKREEPISQLVSRRGASL